MRTLKSLDISLEMYKLGIYYVFINEKRIGLNDDSVLAFSKSLKELTLIEELHIHFMRFHEVKEYKRYHRNDLKKRVEDQFLLNVTYQVWNQIFLALNDMDNLDSFIFEFEEYLFLCYCYY